jgi:CBS domain-containing protein
MEIAGTVSRILAQKPASVWSISPQTMVYDAIALMAEKNCGALPVVENGRLLGVISERDYSRKVILKGKSSRETPVRDIMATDLFVAHPEDSVTDCMRVMTERRVRHLPVMDGNRLIGIVSIGDLVNWTISAQQATIDHLERYITGDYPA